ncbi:Vesicle-associated membrane protein 4 [Manis javanica]|nr:Vesicle-associated membrane protein 4 [Manis javanica]
MSLPGLNFICKHQKQGASGQRRTRLSAGSFPHSRACSLYKKPAAVDFTSDQVTRHPFLLCGPGRASCKHELPAAETAMRAAPPGLAAGEAALPASTPGIVRPQNQGTLPAHHPRAMSPSTLGPGKTDPRGWRLENRYCFCKEHKALMCPNLANSGPPTVHSPAVFLGWPPSRTPIPQTRGLRNGPGASGGGPRCEPLDRWAAAAASAGGPRAPSLMTRVQGPGPARAWEAERGSPAPSGPPPPRRAEDAGGLDERKRLCDRAAAPGPACRLPARPRRRPGVAPGLPQTQVVNTYSAGNERRNLLEDDSDEEEDFFLRGPSGPRFGPRNDKIKHVQNQVDEVIDVMQENITKVIERGERLDDLQDQSESLSDNAAAFSSRSKQLRRQMWWRGCKMKASVALVAVVLSLVIIILIVVRYRI